jgi:para-aminobenzoate synthetase component 1
MRQIDLNADELSSALLGLAQHEDVAILDSCGVGHLGSDLMIAGIRPIESLEIESEDPAEALAIFERHLAKRSACIFTISYDLGPKLEQLITRPRGDAEFVEPDIFLSRFDALVVHQYSTGATFVTGDADAFYEIESHLASARLREPDETANAIVESNFTRAEYLDAIDTIKEYIRRGDTYQTNLTRQLRLTLPDGLSSETIFARLRRQHPAPFASFIKRKYSTVVSASPERFFKVSDRSISASPVKGTRPRGATEVEDSELKAELASSEKDRAENTMIVDLLRSDLGRVCEYGGVNVERICEIEEHPTLFHLVSTIAGTLRPDSKFTDVLRALFPCGSITGAPKIRTMEIIDEIEPAVRGLSMGAIGYYIPESGFEGLEPGFDLSVAIRTMVVRGREAVFNVGGGITIDSDPSAEYEESETKAMALLGAVGNK